MEGKGNERVLILVNIPTVSDELEWKENETNVVYYWLISQQFPMNWNGRKRKRTWSNIG